MKNMRQPNQYDSQKHHVDEEGLAKEHAARDI